MSTEVHLRTSQDAWVNEDGVLRNYGEELKLSVKGNNPEKRVYIGFSLKSLPSDANIHEATLRLRLRGDWTGSSEITVDRIDEKWAERKITWDHKPSVSGVSVTETISSGAGGDLVEVDVTSIVAASVERGNPWHGLRVIVDSSGTRNFHSSEASDHSLRPHLFIRYSEPVAQPNRLRPRGGDAVNASQPRLAWNIEHQQSESQVQVNFEDDFDSPDYDSDWVVNTDNGWDLETATSPTFSALSDAEEFYWRVRIRDGDGNQSDWSHAAHAIRRTYGTFSIDSPATDGDAVEESSPTIITSLTGRNLTRLGWQLRRRRVATVRPDIIAHDSFESGYKTDDGSFELERRSVRNPDADYFLRVRAWDQFDRGTAVGERSYIEAERMFVYDPVPGVSPVTSLVATQAVEGDPRLTLSWERGSAPDTFDIYMDNELVDAKVDPVDVFVSGTSYAHDFWNAQPGREHTFVVVATENGTDSTSNPEETITPTIRGAWLVCKPADLACVFGDHNQPKMQLAEVGETFRLLNRNDPVRIVGGRGGLEGDLTGELRADVYGTAETKRRALLDMLELSPDVRIRLIVPFTNIPVIIGELSPPIQPPGDVEKYEASISFWQYEEFELGDER